MKEGEEKKGAGREGGREEKELVWMCVAATLLFIFMLKGRHTCKGTQQKHKPLFLPISPLFSSLLRVVHFEA